MSNQEDFYNIATGREPSGSLPTGEGGGRGRISICGIGPGSPEDITPAVLKAVGGCDVVVGYKYYFQFIEP